MEKFNLNSSKEKMDLLEELYDEGYLTREISDLIEIPLGTVRGYINARKLGFQRWVDQLNECAKKAGYKSHSHRTIINKIAKNQSIKTHYKYRKEPIRNQEEFEKSFSYIEELEEKVQLPNIEQKIEIKEDIRRILQVYENIPPENNRDNPNSIKSKVLKMYFLDNASLEEIAKEFNQTRANISLIKNKALKELKEFLKENNVYSY